MVKKDFPTPAVLRQLLEYEPHTGKLFWKPRERERFADKRSFSTWNKRFAGKEALTAIASGYRVGNVNYKLCSAHRVIWAIAHGQWPSDEIDHINGDRSENRIINLRQADRSQNASNTCLRSDNTSGYRGVSFHSSVRKWEARIYLHNRCFRLGFFDDKEEAYKAYLSASKKLHGAYARV